MSMFLCVIIIDIIYKYLALRQGYPQHGALTPLHKASLCRLHCLALTLIELLIVIAIVFFLTVLLFAYAQHDAIGVAKYRSDARAFPAPI